MAVVLGLLVSLTYGAGDFFGGLAAKRARAGAVVLGSFALATVLLAGVTLTWWLLGSLPSPQGRDLALGAATGVVGPVAVGLLYHGLAVGRMSVVAPITAVIAAVVPFGWGLATGDRPGPVALVGVVAALVAVAFISGAPEHADSLREPGEAPLRSDRGVVAVAAGAGLGFGVVYVLLGSTTDEPGLWPLMVARPLAVVLAATTLAVVARARRRPFAAELVVPTGARHLVAAAGVLDVGANALYLAATREGLLSIVAVLVVGYLLLYPLANNTGTVGADPRYLYPMLPALALLIAGLVPSPRWLPSSVVVLVVAGLAAASTSWGMVGLDEVRTLDVRFLEAPGTSRVIDLLEDRDVRFAVTDLAGTQITYETGGRVKASSFAVPRFDDLECLMLVEQPSTYVLDNNLANNVANLEWYLATNEIPYTKQQIGTWTVVFAEEWVPPWEAGLGMLLGVVREPDCPAPGVAPG